jgi:hypothetical protein
MSLAGIGCLGNPSSSRIGMSIADTPHWIVSADASEPEVQTRLPDRAILEMDPLWPSMVI